MDGRGAHHAAATALRADLLAALAEAGFERVQTFGRMALPAEPFEADRAGDLVVVARCSV